MMARQRHDWVERLPLAIDGGFAFANHSARLLVAGPSRRSDYIASIHPDAGAQSNTLAAMAAMLDRLDDVGAVGAQRPHDDGRSPVFGFPVLRARQRMVPGRAHRRD